MKLPPYARKLDTARHGRLLMVCAGRQGWDRARSPTWFGRAKVVLPFNEDPAMYDWCVAAGHDCVIDVSGELEAFDTIVSLAGLLLAAGARSVLYNPLGGPLTRIDAKRPDHGL